MRLVMLLGPVLARVRLLATFVAVCASSGCGSSGAPVDGALARDAAETIDGSLGSPVNIPWLDDGAPPVAPPVLTPCPEGWREVSDESGVATCDPYPEAGPLDCPAGQAHFPGEPACAPVGSPCPAGDFSDTLPADATVFYLRPGGTGDGMSPTSPHGSLLSAPLDSLPDGTVIALSRGTHEGPVHLARGLELRGACAAESLLTTGVPADREGVVTLDGAVGALADLTVADSPRPAVRLVGAGAEAVIEGVVITGTEKVALTSFDGARLTAHAVVVRETRGLSGDGRFGAGLAVETGATAEARRMIIEGSRSVGVAVTSTGSALTLSDVVVRDTRGQDVDGAAGDGLAVNLGASVEVRRTLFESNRNSGAYAAGAGTAVRSADIVVRDTRSQRRGAIDGRGLSVLAGAVFEVGRALLERNRLVGASADGVDASLSLSDAVVRDTQPEELDRSVGRGFAAQNGASVELNRVSLDRNREIGGSADDEGTSVTLTDVLVRDTRPQESDGTRGSGLEIQDGARASLDRVVFERNRSVDVFGDGSLTMLTLSDVVSRDTEEQLSDGLFGRGLALQARASAEVSRALFERNREVGVYAAVAGTSVTLSDVVVRDTLPRGCARPPCAEASFGMAVGSYLGGNLTVTRFEIARADLCGVHVATGGEVDLHEGDVRESSIGVCIQDDGYDLGRLQDGVRFVDNGTNLQATDLPVPELIP